MNESKQLDWEKLHFEDSIIVDLHAHPSLKLSLFNRLLTRRYIAAKIFNPFSFRSNLPNLKRGGVDIIFSAIYPPEMAVFEKDCPPLKLLRFIMPRTWRKVFSKPYFDVANDLMNELETAVEKSKPAAQLVKSISELDEWSNQKKDRPVAVIHCLEGAHSLSEKVENLEHFFERGVAYLTLAHFTDNHVAHPCFPYPEYMHIGKCFTRERDITKGLTPLGEQVVEEMVRLGMLIDITHCTPPARKRVFEIVNKRAPLLASHLGAYDINPDPYNLEDWEIKAISESGGLVSVIFMNYWLVPYKINLGLNAISKTIRHFVDVAGIDHVGFGSDFDGFTDPPDDLKDASELPRLTRRLIAEAYKEEEITKILGGNSLQVLREGWGRN